MQKAYKGIPPDAWIKGFKYASGDSPDLLLAFQSDVTAAYLSQKGKKIVKYLKILSIGVAGWLRQLSI